MTMCVSTRNIELKPDSHRPIPVAAAVIKNGAGQVLLSQRSLHQPEGGKWEFPGGKVEAGETVEQALHRELLEELGIRPTQISFLLRVPFRYEKLSVELFIFEVHAYQGRVVANEGQPLTWVDPAQLAELTTPAANQGILTALRLPSLVGVTPEPELMPNADHRFLERLEAVLLAGVPMVQFRAKGLQLTQKMALANASRTLCDEYGSFYLHNGSVEEAIKLNAEGVHFDSHRLRHCTNLRKHPRLLYSSACHSMDELQMATQLQMDFVFISPVSATHTHPEAVPLGWQKTKELLDLAPMPAYLLGGMGGDDFKQAFEFGAQGLAFTSALWQESESIPSILGAAVRVPYGIRV